MKKAISSRASELSYSCYDLLSLKSFSLSSFSFLVSAPFSFTLRALGGFYLSNEPLILFFCHYLIRSGWKAIFVILSSRFLYQACVSVCVDCSKTKWCKVFMPWFLLALVVEVDAGVKVVWHGGARSPSCTPSLINMQHGGRFALDLIALIGWTHFQHTHTLGFSSSCH